MIWISICVLLVCVIVSLPLWIFIYKSISSKPLVYITLADLIYQDIIIYVYLLSLSYGLAVVHTIYLDDENLGVNFKLAVLYALIITFFGSTACVSITISSILRLISLIKVSEAAGFQLLGPDNVAVVIIRLASIAISVFWPFCSIYYFGAYPLNLGLFYLVENHTIQEDFKENKLQVVYLFPSVLSALVGLVVKLYSVFANKPFKTAQAVFAIHLPDTEQPVVIFEHIFSIIYWSAIPLLIITSVLQSFFKRKQRLLINCPVIVFLACIVLPLSVIRANDKLRQSFTLKYLQPFQMGVISFHTKCKKIFSRQVGAL